MPKSTIEEMQTIAGERGGKCLSEKYINGHSKLTWQCKDGHQWKSVPDSIKQGHWCPACAGCLKGTLEEMQKVAGEHGGKCLSREYINNDSKLIWQCKEGHQWGAVPGSIKRGHWCPTCVGCLKSTIEEMQKIAGERGGRCLSEKYINGNSKLTWQCKDEHQWKSAPGSIKQGHWCPTCARLKGTIEEMQKIAGERGGKCLSREYININSKLIWQCKEGHQWGAVPASIKQGHWCPACAGKKKVTIEEMREIANKRGGKCLSEKYNDNRTKLTWQCKSGHQWEASPGNIKQGGWCPTCLGKEKGAIDEVREIANERGGKCLSEKYTNSKTKLTWQCKKGHLWKNTPGNVKRGQWCPACTGKK